MPDWEEEKRYSRKIIIKWLNWQLLKLNTCTIYFNFCKLFYFFGNSKRNFRNSYVTCFFIYLNNKNIKMINNNWALNMHCIYQFVKLHVFWSCNHLWKHTKKIDYQSVMDLHEIFCLQSYWRILFYEVWSKYLSPVGRFHSDSTNSKGLKQISTFRLDLSHWCNSIEWHKHMCCSPFTLNKQSYNGPCCFNPLMPETFIPSNYEM